VPRRFGRPNRGGEQRFRAAWPTRAYQADEDEATHGFGIVWLDTPPDWLFRQAADEWREVVAARASARASTQRIDARAVLFGQPLLEALAEGILAASAGRAVAKERELELTRGIHAQWLMTARADLGGCTPRDVLLADRGRICWDVEHRSEQWSRQGHAPPPLAATSVAYRLGGFGITEVVLYFDMVRALLAEAWHWTRETPSLTQPSLVDRLAEFRDVWLRVPNESTSFSMSPAELIESERRRMPVTSDGSHLDCDCPICQAEADGAFGSGPTFRCFDGHHLELEDEFAFSLCVTREEWEKEQEDYRQFSEKFDREERERAARGEDAAGPLGGSAWKTSFVDWDGMAQSDSSPLGPLLALGFPLAELTSDLKERLDGVAGLKALNEAYAALRASQDAAARDSAAEEFRERLEAARQFPKLTAKCADLQSRVDEVLRRLSIK
jgi:hypothetical protein